MSVTTKIAIKAVLAAVKAELSQGKYHRNRELVVKAVKTAERLVEKV